MKAIIKLGSLSNMIDIKEIVPEYHMPLLERWTKSECGATAGLDENDVMYSNGPKRMIFDYHRTFDIDGTPVALYVFKEIRD